jgi:hypothetical protein
MTETRHTQKLVSPAAMMAALHEKIDSVVSRLNGFLRNVRRISLPGEVPAPRVKGPKHDLAEPSGRTSRIENDFFAVRGRAIQSYATLEQSIAQLFCGLADLKIEVAQIIFFKITSSNSRNNIVEKLFRRRFGSEYKVFRNSLLKQLRTIDRRRNEIVHWNVIEDIAIAADGKGTSVLKLTPPAFWIRDDETADLTKNDLSAFVVQCDFYSRLINMFGLTTGLISLSTPPSEEDKKPWLEIFNQSVVYPAPGNHPLRYCP